MMLRVLKFFIGILLLPICVAISHTVVSLVLAIEPARDVIIPPSALALLAGFALWLLVYFFLPRPARTYVLAHELTHALWGCLMGARIVDMKVHKDSGSVTLSKTNFLITLAPYFFPLYTFMVIIAYFVCSIFMNVEAHYLVWLGLVGLTWGFHITFTISTLLQRQSDIRQNGRLFSYTFIYFLNVLGIAFWIVLTSSATLEQMFRFLAHDTEAVTLFSWGLVCRLWNFAGKRQ